MQPEDVFVTDGFPHHTYVSIDEGKPEHDLGEGLAQQSKIISITGPSKSGKSTLCDKFFGRERGVGKIYVTGDAIAEPQDLWRDAYMQIAGEANPGFYELSHSELIDLLSARGIPLIVDDFHYISKESQITLCRQLKNAASAGLRIILLSIAHRGDDPVRSNPDLSGRYFSVNFRFWTPQDLEQIANLGFPKVGIPTSSTIHSELAAEALRSPQIMQTLCLEVCRALPQDTPYEYVTSADLDLNAAKVAALRSYNMNSAFHLLRHGPPERGKKRLTYELVDGTSADLYQLLVRVLEADPPFHELSLEDIKLRMRSFLAGPDEPDIRRALQQLAKIYKGQVSPIEWDDEKRLLTIVDPHFYFYLRNRETAVPV